MSDIQEQGEKADEMTTWLKTFLQFLDFRVTYEIEAYLSETSSGSDNEIDPLEHLESLDSWHAVRQYAYENSNADIHPLIASIPELVDAWEIGCAAADFEWREEFEEKERLAKVRAREEYVESRLAAKDWAALNLPTPRELLADLQTGTRCEVGGHILNTDEDGVWITNPYGVDCALWQEFDAESIEQFLMDMARGEEYGPVPW